MSGMGERITEFQKSGQNKAALIEEIVKDVVNRKDHYGFRDRDQALELLGGFYHRIDAMIEKYRGTDKGFEPYMSSSLHYFKKNEECLARERNFRESGFITRPEFHAYSVSDAYGDQGIPECEEEEAAIDPERFMIALSVDPERSASRVSASKRVLFLALKCAFLLEDAHIERLGRITGLGEGHLRSRVDALKELAEDRYRRRESHVRLRDKIYASLCFYENRLKDELDPEKREEWKGIIARHRRRLQSVRQKIRAVPVQPTNEEIAMVMGLPKGTVDSGLHYLKNRDSALRDAARKAYIPRHGNTIRFGQRPQARGDAGAFSRKDLALSA